MRKNIAGAVVAILVVFGGVVWEWPLRALDALGVLMTVIGLPALYDSLVTWLANHPHAVIDIGPWAMMAMGGVALGYLIVWPPLLALIKHRPLEFVFDPQSDKCVRSSFEMGQNVTRFCVGIRNNRRDKKTIQFVNVRAHDNEFARESLATPGRNITNGDVMLVEPIMLDARATHYFQLFGISADMSLAKDDPFWGRKHSFTLDARGRDVEVVETKFEFYALENPMLHMLR